MQLACTERLWGSATQVALSRDRALEPREHTLAEQWIPRRHIGKDPGQPPQLACTGFAAGQRDSGRLESAGQNTRCAGTQAQGWRTLVAPLRGAHGTHAGSPAQDGLGNM